MAFYIKSKIHGFIDLEKYYDKDRLDKVLDNFWANLIRENLDMGIWKLEDLHLHMRKLNNAEDFILFLDS